MKGRFEIFNKFQKFHRENQSLFDEYRKLAWDLLKAGRKHYSSDALIHVLRFRRDIQTIGGDFKISNDFTAYYARMLDAVFPEFRGFFTLKLSDDSDLNFIKEKDFRNVYFGKSVVINEQLELF